MVQCLLVHNVEINALGSWDTFQINRTHGRVCLNDDIVFVYDEQYKIEIVLNKP